MTSDLLEDCEGCGGTGEVIFQILEKTLFDDEEIIWQPCPDCEGRGCVEAEPAYYYGSLPAPFQR